MDSELTNVSNKSQVIELRLWIFKLVWNELAVSVEGYRAKDGGERELYNWRSSPVVQRLNSRTLITKSGSKYFLRGPIDEGSLIVLGYPRVLVHQFKEGFPPDWRELLLEFHSSFTKNGFLSTTRWFLTNIVRASKDASRDVSVRSSVTCSAAFAELPADRTSRRHPLTLVQHQKNSSADEETIVDEQEPEVDISCGLSHQSKTTRNEGVKNSWSRQQSQSNLEAGGSKEKESLLNSAHPESDGMDDGTAVFKIPHLPAASKRSLPVVKLYNWTVLFSVHDRGDSTMFPDFGLVLEGHNDKEHCNWKTSCIVAVKDSRHLQTTSTVYELVGPINTIIAEQQGYSKEFIASFLDGFPRNWHAVISTFFDTYVKPNLALEWLTNSQPKAVTEGAAGARWERDEQYESPESDDDYMSTDINSEDHSSASALHFPLGKRIQNAPTASKKGKKSRVAGGDCRNRNKHVAAEVTGRRSAGQSSKNRHIPKKSAVGVTLKRNRQRPVKREDVVRLSRSGRVLKRPLASWAGEHIVYDVYGNAVKAVGVTTESSMTTGGGIETSAVVSHLGLSPLHGPRQKERESLGCRGYPKPKRRSSNKRHSIASSNSSLVCESPTSFVGQQRKQAWHVIKSSPEEDHGTAATNQKAKKAKHLKKTKRPRNRGVLKKKTAKKVAERRSEKENQTAEANNEEVENMELNAPRDDDEGSVSVTEFVADETRSSEGAVVEGRTQLEKHQSCSRWRKDEIERLKLAMRALAPREEMDWEKVAKSLDGREASECLAEAQKRWGWRPQKRLTQLQEESQLEKLAYAAGKAKVGTVSYQVKAQRFTRKYMVAGGESDFFEETMALSTSNMVKGLPSVASFDPDDSLLDVLRTPVPSNVKRINQRQFIPDLVASTDSSHDESRSPAVRIVDSAERDRREFYVYKLLKNKSCNTSRFNASCMDVSKGRTFRKYQLNIPASAHSFDGEQEEQDAGDDEYFSSDDDN